MPTWASTELAVWGVYVSLAAFFIFSAVAMLLLTKYERQQLDESQDESGQEL